MNDYPYGACPIRGPLDGPGGDPRCEQPRVRPHGLCQRHEDEAVKLRERDEQRKQEERDALLMSIRRVRKSPPARAGACTRT